MSSGYIFPAPKDWQNFLRLISRTYQFEFPEYIIDEYGREGQSQYGVDTFVQLPHGNFYAIQCKLKADIEDGRITDKLIQDEIDKTARFPHTIDRYVIHTTLNSDIKAQNFVLALNAERTRDGKFPIELKFWNWVEMRAPKHPHLLAEFWPGMSVRYLSLSEKQEQPKEKNDSLPYELPEILEQFRFNQSRSIALVVCIIAHFFRKPVPTFRNTL